MGGCMSQEFSRNDLTIDTGISCKLSSYTFHWTGVLAETKLNHTDTLVYPTVNNIRFASSDGSCLISYDNAVFFLKVVEGSPLGDYVEIIHNLNEKILECNDEYLVTQTQYCKVDGFNAIVPQHCFTPTHLSTNFKPEEEVVVTTKYDHGYCLLFKIKNIVCVESTPGTISQFLGRGRYFENKSVSIKVPGTSDNTSSHWTVTVPADIDANVVSIRMNMMSFCVLFSNRQVWCLGAVLLSDGFNLESGKISMSDLVNEYRLVAENVKRLSGNTIYFEFFPLLNTTAGSGLDVFNDCEPKSTDFPFWAILTIVGVLSLVLTALGFWYYRRSKQSAYQFVQKE